MESKKYDKVANVTKKKQTHRYREQSSGHQGGGAGESEVQMTVCDINKLPGYTVPHGEYSQSLMIINGL